MAIKGIFYNLDTPTLQTLLTNWLNCLTAISVAGQSYVIGQRSFTRANLAEVQNVIRELNEAIRYNQGNRVTRTKVTLYPQQGT